jgi:hypothetical protein
MMVSRLTPKIWLLVELGNVEKIAKALEIDIMEILKEI